MIRFSGICIITKDVPRLHDFYQRVLQVEAEGDSTHVTLATEGAGIALFTEQGMEQIAPGSTKGIGCGNCVLAFEVQDVDREYERLAAMGAPVVKPPETYPWGARSAWFRDPGGNIVDLYQGVQPPGGSEPPGGLAAERDAHADPSHQRQPPQSRQHLQAHRCHPGRSA